MARVSFFRAGLTLVFCFIAFNSGESAVCRAYKTQLRSLPELEMCEEGGFRVSKSCLRSRCLKRFPKVAAWKKAYLEGMSQDPGGMPNPNAIACESAGGRVELVRIQEGVENAFRVTSLCFFGSSDWVESDYVLNYYASKGAK